MFGFCLSERRGRSAVPLLVWAVLVALLGSLLTLTTTVGAAPARAVESECAPLALAPFGDPGEAVARGTLEGGAQACYTVTAQAGRHQVSVEDPRDGAYANVVDADGASVECTAPGYGVRWCDFPAAGVYTVVVDNSGSSGATDYQLAVVALAGSEGCAEPVGTSWGQPVTSGTAVSPVEVDCRSFRGAPGERVVVYRGSNVRQWITDASGTDICVRDDEDGCVLPGDGPYRVLSYVFNDDQLPYDYEFQVRRLSDAEGCPVVAVGVYGTVPEAGGVRCRSLSVLAAGRYLVNPIGREQGDDLWSYVYDGAGRKVCQAGGWCAFPAAGTYTLVVGDPTAVSDSEYATVFLDRTGTEGCRTVGWGLYQGEFGGPGQYDCLVLPGARGVPFGALTSLGGRPDADYEVVDSAGVGQCDETTLSAGTCAPTGTAPYRLLVHSDSGTLAGAYGIDLVRTDTAQGCAELPAGSFDVNGAKASFATGGGVFAHCLTIPANGHTKAEIFQLIATSGGVSAGFSVVDSTGKQVCERWATTNGWTVCGLTPGSAHTVLVNGWDKVATYTLARRDVTASAGSAGCVTSAAAKVGGASLVGAYGGPGTLSCRRITTSGATDVVHMNVRDALGTGNIAVIGADGNTECSYRNNACAVTGSTSHQVLVQVPATLRAPDAFRLDALRIATAEGPAPECVKVPSVAYGYGPILGRLDEAHTAVCAALPTSGFDHFKTEIKDTTGAADTAVPALYNASTWANGCIHYIPEGYDCDPLGSSWASTPSVFVLGLPEKVSATSYSARLVCSYAQCGPEKLDVTGVSPATGAAGTKVTLTVTGAALPADSVVRLAQSGRTLTARTVGVSPDNRTLTATLDLTGETATGTWSVSVIARGREFQRGLFTVAEPQLRSTAPPKVTGTVKVGAKVTAAPGSWSAAPSSYSFQWKADGKAIAGATAAAYVVPAGQLGRKLSVTVTAVKGGWKSGSATSAAVAVARGDAPKATKLPVIGGTAKVGKALKTSAGTWSPAATSYAYQWYAGGQAIAGATKSSLVLKAAQKGKKITVKVTARRAGHQDGVAVSKATGAVAR
ncbi:Tat pathway signal protein [Streptomyces sp. NBC_00576]|uniref:Tat pathway signal protein n=1 Tax=Streptomyces sp. NBC_00576 TaxID=2903665 RepID=UPI002E806E5D|nr:Tat pathway signal protein [Streptomyces sp. NBC_00576]WUB72433.1 Tat pathway signal protein [Streptomyces sp. NBC_00576]